MKEATGELNMTVVTVVAIAAVAAFFYAFVWPSIRGSIISSTKCATAVNCKCESQNADTCTCNALNDDGSIGEEVTCPNNQGGKK